MIEMILLTVMPILFVIAPSGLEAIADKVAEKKNRQLSNKNRRKLSEVEESQLELERFSQSIKENVMNYRNDIDRQLGRASQAAARRSLQNMGPGEWQRANPKIAESLMPVDLKTAIETFNFVEPEDVTKIYYNTLNLKKEKAAAKAKASTYSEVDWLPLDTSVKLAQAKLVSPIEPKPTPPQPYGDKATAILIDISQTIYQLEKLELSTEEQWLLNTVKDDHLPKAETLYKELTDLNPADSTQSQEILAEMLTEVLSMVLSIKEAKVKEKEQAMKTNLNFLREKNQRQGIAHGYTIRK